MTWDYRVVRVHYPEPDDSEDDVRYQIHEVYYDDDGRAHSRTIHASEPTAETLAGLREELQRMLAALDQPVLVDGPNGLTVADSDEICGQ